VAYGPILEEASIRDDHFKSRDIIAAFEKELADCMKKSGYDVINTANCKKTLDPDLWAKVNDAFAEHFPKLKRVTENRTGCSD